MVSPEGIIELLISLSFSWAKIRSLPVSFRAAEQLNAVIPVMTQMIVKGDRGLKSRMRNHQYRHSLVVAI